MAAKSSPVQPSEAAANVLLGLITEEWREIHHIESERASFTNILIVVESGAVALIAQRSISLPTLPICVLLVLLGLVGLLTTAKYYERFRFAQTRLTEMYHQLDCLCPAARIIDVLRSANMKHDAGGRGLTFCGVHLKRLPLNIMWRVVHLIAAGAGVILGVVAIVRGLR